MYFSLMWDILICLLFFTSTIILIFYYIDLFSSIRENERRCSSDSKDFRIGDPVAHSHLYQNGSRFSYISWFDSSYDHFCLETDDWYSPDQIRHVTPEELEKYFRK